MIYLKTMLYEACMKYAILIKEKKIDRNYNAKKDFINFSMEQWLGMFSHLSIEI